MTGDDESKKSTTENVIEGVVVTFIEIDKLRNYVEEATREWEFYEAIFDSLREPVLVLDDNLNVVSANNRFYTTFRMGPKHTLGKTVFELGKGQWNLPRLRELLEDVLPEDNFFQDFELEADFVAGGRHRLVLNARRLQGVAWTRNMILLAMEDTPCT